MSIRNLLFGAPKNPLDPKVFERLALAAFLAWVGLGADGLSSSCYGPEEIFKELGEHRALAPFLILAVIITVGTLSAGYSSTIDRRTRLTLGDHAYLARGGGTRWRVPGPGLGGATRQVGYPTTSTFEHLDDWEHAVGRSLREDGLLCVALHVEPEAPLLWGDK